MSNQFGCRLNPNFFIQSLIGGRLNTHSVFCEFCRGPCQHATRGRDIVQYTDTVQWPRTKGTAVNE